MNHTCGCSVGLASRKRINYRIVTDIILEVSLCAGMESLRDIPGFGKFLLLKV